MLGDDGGQVCETADSELVQGYWKLRLMVGGEFYVRAVRLDGRIRQGLSLVVDVYCPEKRPDIEDFFEVGVRRCRPRLAGRPCRLTLSANA